MSGLLEGHLAAVTGGASGIGRAIAKGFAAEGAEVVILDANAEAAAAVCGDIREAGHKAQSMALDVRDRAMCARIARQVTEAIGPVSILVNSAGINRRNPITGDRETVAQDWDDIMGVNLDGMFNVTQAFLEPLRARKGRVINIGSIQSFMHVRWPNSPAYTTSKHGVLGLTRAIAVEMAPLGVRCNCIIPGFIRTEALDRIPDEQKGKIEARIPMRHMGSCEELAEVAAFLLSDAASHVTGQDWAVDGGVLESIEV